MKGLKEKQYLSVPKRVFDPISVFVSVGLLVAVLMSVLGFNYQGQSQVASALLFSDFRSFFFVVGGTFACLLFQFDFVTFFNALKLSALSFFSSPIRQVSEEIEELDEAIVRGKSILSVREGKEISGELLNDIVHMVREKLFFEEIEQFIGNKVASTFLARKLAVTLLNKGAKIAPALGLLGTVIGLIEVLQSLDNPTKIGPAMSLALMTTAFGSILGSFVFTPLAGRLENHNTLYVETHRLLMNRVNVLLQREDRRLNPVLANKKLEPSG